MPEEGRVTTLEMCGLDLFCKSFGKSQKVTESHNRIAVGVRITGRVQGVCFRAWTEAEARRLGVSGWVKNEADGSVRALFVGQPAAVEELLGHCRQGPPAARVSDVESTPVTPVPEITGFRVAG